MSIQTLLIFTAVVSIFVIGITGVGWYYFHRWYIEEKANGRRQIDVHKAELERQRRAGR